MDFSTIKRMISPGYVCGLEYVFTVEIKYAKYPQVLGIEVVAIYQYARYLS